MSAMLRNTKIWPNRSVFFALVLLLGCNNKPEKEPIVRQKMAEILLDIHLAEAYAGVMSGVDTSANSKITGKNLDTLARSYASVLAHHQTSYSDFQNALQWYHLHPSNLDSVYALVLPKLDSLKTIHLEEVKAQ